MGTQVPHSPHSPAPVSAQDAIPTAALPQTQRKRQPRLFPCYHKAQGMLLKFTPRLSGACQQECSIPKPPAHLLLCLIFAFGTDKREKPKQQSPGPPWAQHIHLSTEQLPESCSHPGLEGTCLCPCERTANTCMTVREAVQ